MASIRERLDQLIAEGEEFTFENFARKSERGYPESLSPTWFSWCARSKLIVEHTFGMNSAIGEILQDGLDIAVLGNGQDKFNRAVSHMIGSLRAAKDAIDQSFSPAPSLARASSPDQADGKVFIVHGHDNELKTELEVFLRGIGLEPVVLHRQPDEGRTILEKFEHHSNVGYAFVLLTPDEIAFLVSQLDLPDTERKLEHRARPNVIFEFGYFVGRLGRSRVCCIYRGEVTLPSDINGLVYKQVGESIDSIGFSLVKELRVAGYAISI